MLDFMEPETVQTPSPGRWMRPTNLSKLRDLQQWRKVDAVCHNIKMLLVGGEQNEKQVNKMDKYVGEMRRKSEHVNAQKVSLCYSN